MKEPAEEPPRSRQTTLGDLGATLGRDSLEKKIAEHKISIEDEIYNDTWKSCCMELDRRAVQYFTQIIIIGGIMSFTIVQLTRLNTCEGQQAYLGLLTLLIGILIPHPQFKDV